MTQAPETTVVQLEQDGDWATIWLNRPDARNAMSDALIQELQACLDYVATRADIRGLAVRGRGDVFCAGGDLKGFKDNFQNARSRDEVIADSSKMGHFFLTVRSMPQVVVFLVHGAAMAGGLGMACAGDMVIGVKDTRMALTETAIGVVPAQIGRFIIERVGEFNARYIMLTAQRFTAVEGKTFGLVDFLVDDVAAGEAKLAEIIGDVRRCAPQANAATKRLLQANKELDSQAMIQYAGELFADAVQSDEGREGVASFLEKRKPSWVQES